MLFASIDDKAPLVRSLANAGKLQSSRYGLPNTELDTRWMAGY